MLVKPGDLIACWANFVAESELEIKYVSCKNDAISSNYHFRRIQKRQFLLVEKQSLFYEGGYFLTNQGKLMLYYKDVIVVYSSGF